MCVTEPVRVLYLLTCEAKRQRFLRPCVCEFLPRFAEHAATATCSTQTIAPDILAQQVQTCASEQGSIQLADDGRAEAHMKIDEIRTLLVGLQNVKLC